LHGGGQGFDSPAVHQHVQDDRVLHDSCVTPRWPSTTCRQANRMWRDAADGAAYAEESGYPDRVPSLPPDGHVVGLAGRAGPWRVATTSRGGPTPTVGPEATQALTPRKRRGVERAEAPPYRGQRGRGLASGGPPSRVRLRPRQSLSLRALATRRLKSSRPRARTAKDTSAARRNTQRRTSSREGRRRPPGGPPPGRRDRPRTQPSRARRSSCNGPR
jgi:hypothetical protein